MAGWSIFVCILFLFCILHFYLVFCIFICSCVCILYLFICILLQHFVDCNVKWDVAGWSIFVCFKGNSPTNSLDCFTKANTIYLYHCFHLVFIFSFFIFVSQEILQPTVWIVLQRSTQYVCIVVFIWICIVCFYICFKGNTPTNSLDCFTKANNFQCQLYIIPFPDPDQGCSDVHISKLIILSWN